MKNRKLKPTLQLTQTECGLCCVRTILEAYDYRLSLTELRQVKEPGRDGLGLQKLKDILEHFNLEAKTYKIKDIKAFTVLNFPVIAYWRNSHYICVESYSEKRVVIMDPSVGRMTLSIEAFQESFSGYVIDTKKGDDFKPRHVKKMSRWKKSFIWPQNMVGLYLKVAIVSILLVGMTLSVPLLTQRFIDHDFAEVSSFHVTLICLGAAAIVMILITYIRTLLSIKMICRFSWHFIQGAFTRVLRLPAKYFTVRAPGEVIYRLNALTRIQDVIGTRLIQAFLDLISGLALLGYVFWTSTTIGIVVLAITLVTLLFLSLTQPFVSSSTDVELHEGSKSQSIQLDAIVSINNVKLGGYVGAYIQDWEESFKKVLNALGKRMKIQQGIINSTLSGIQIFAPLFVLIISLYMAKKQIITFGQAIAIQSVISILFSFTNSVFSTISDSLVAVRYIELAEDIFEYPEERQNGDNIKMTTGSMVLEDLTFKYTQESFPAVKGISIDIKNGETVALVGLSGSGKTTLGKIACSLFTPSSGKIYYDGVNQDDYHLDALRGSIGYIPQEANLHNRTILDNLRLGCDKTDKEIINFCSSLPFLDFIKMFPMGYHTMISEMGANISGGQRQRILVARVLLQKPKILVMDEATSSLDNISQAQVYEALDMLDCTKIVIAHRFATVLNADRILVLQNGCLVQEGKHNELVENEGPYRDLYHAESKGSETYELDYRKLS